MSDLKKPVLLLVDDDEVYCQVLGGALQRRGFELVVANSIDQTERVLQDIVPDYAVLDLCVGYDSGLSLIDPLIGVNFDVRIVMLTGYASIATAVEAIKLGATHYLTKPAGVDEIENALMCDKGDAETPLEKRPVSVKRLEWEHLQKVLMECGGNISEAARTLGMHRRTLQRKLRKRPVKN